MAMKYGVLKPTYYDEFACLASDCTTNCCGVWNIDLSKSEYNRMRHQLPSKELRDLAAVSLKRRKPPKSDFLYATMRLNENQRCPFESKEGLCSIQVECGYQYLSNVCKKYPRVTSSISEVITLGLYNSCEAVIDLLMKHPEGVQIDTSEQEFVPAHLTCQHLYPDAFVESHPIYYSFWNIRTLGLSILQNREHTLEERLLLWALAMNRVTTLEENQEYDKIADTLEVFSDPETQTELLSSFSAVPLQYPLQINAGVYCVVTGVSNFNFYKDIADTIMKNLTEPGSSSLITEEKYLEALQNLDAFLADGREHYFENFMVNEFFTNQQPFSLKDFSVWDNTIFFTYVYSNLRFCLAGYMADGATDEKFRYVATLFARYYLHNTEMSSEILKNLKLANNNNMELLARLIKSK